MPIYEYKKTDESEGCAYCQHPFDVRQSINDPKLAQCPQCGGPVVKCITAVGINTALPKTRSVLSEKNLKEKGFHKLVNEGDGKFRKVT